MKKALLLFYFLFAISNLAESAPVIDSFNPSNIIGGIGQILTINGSGFGNQRDTSFVSFFQESGKYLDTVARGLKYLSWSDTKIELEMPVSFSEKIHINIAGEEYSSVDSLHVKANLGYRLVNPLDYIFLTNRNTQGGYTFYMHRSYWENPEAKAAIEDVIREFRCETGVNYILALEPSDAPLDLGDTVNIIGPDSAMNDAGYMSMLWGSCILGQTTFYQWNTMDLHMSSKLEWYFGKGKVTEWKAKFRYVMMHEMGHSLGLGHVNELGQTMYPIVTNLPVNAWNERDTMTAEEQIAMSFFVKKSQEFTFNDCGISPMVKNKNCQDIYGITSVQDFAEEKTDFEVYPNPTQGYFKIKSILKTGENLNLQIFDILGNKIYEKDNFNPADPGELNTHSFAKGIYFIKIRCGNSISVEKLVIE